MTEPVFPVAEKFVSVNGEGLQAGRPAAFIRFTGCNLNCSYCDTRWAHEPGAEEAAEACALADLVTWVRQTGVDCVTLTGGEPLLQPHLPALVRGLLAVDDPQPLRVEIETNGACDLAELAQLRKEARVDGLPGQLVFTVDCKLPGAGAAEHAAMKPGNYELLQEGDAVKFVAGSRQDLETMERVVRDHALTDRCTVLASPVFGCIEPVEIVDFLIARKLFKVQLQLQLHKIIWPGIEKGV